MIRWSLLFKDIIYKSNIKRESVSLALLFMALVWQSLFFRDNYSEWMTLILLVFGGYNLIKELGKEDVFKHLLLATVLLGVAVGSRYLGFFTPGYNAMAAIVMLIGLNSGRRIGFLSGVLAPLITNFVFIQGPWTPFQMFGYGLMGFIMGVPYISNKVSKSPVLLVVISATLGVGYSLYMDIWTMLSFNYNFNISHYLFLISQALPYTVKYALSNGSYSMLLNYPVKVFSKKLGIQMYEEM